MPSGIIPFGSPGSGTTWIDLTGYVSAPAQIRAECVRSPELTRWVMQEPTPLMEFCTP